MGVDAQAVVSGGVVERMDGLSFGGSHHLAASDTEPEQIIVSVWDENSTEQTFQLGIGDRLEFAGQTWRLDEIDTGGRYWYATLTRVA